MKLNQIISNIKTRQILTSRGHPTVEVEFVTATGVIRASVPAGASVGKHEAMTKCLGADAAYNEEPVTQAINAISHSCKDILAHEVSNNQVFDKLMDILPPNALLPLQICYCKLMAKKRPLEAHISELIGRTEALKIPRTFFNMLNGGAHSGNGFWCQEVLVSFPEPDYRECLRKACIFYEALKRAVAETWGSSAVGDEGGFAPPIKTIDEALELMKTAGIFSNITDYEISFDFAANSFYKNGRYFINQNSSKEKDNGNELGMSGVELGDYYLTIIEKYPVIFSMEDPFAEDDIESWAYFHKKVKKRVTIVADDLTVTNGNRIRKLSEGPRLFDVVLIKPTQAGSLSGTFEAIEAAREGGYQTMVSHRSAETEDTFVSSLSVGVGAEYAKFGAPCRGERVSKYNELSRIYERINERTNTEFDKE